MLMKCLFGASSAYFQGRFLVVRFRERVIEGGCFIIPWISWGETWVPWDFPRFGVFSSKVPAGRENNGAVVHGNKMYLFLGVFPFISWGVDGAAFLWDVNQSYRKGQRIIIYGGGGGLLDFFIFFASIWGRFPI